MASPTSGTPLGPLIRLWGIPTAELPSPTESPDTLAPFIISLLQEAVPFIDSAAPITSTTTTTSNPSANAATTASTDKSKSKKLWKHKADKSHPDSDAKVEVSERIVPAAELGLISARAGTSLTTATTKDPAPEVWMCRRSVHQDAPRKGTASWPEFVRCFRDEHAAAEEAFTPNVLAVHTALEWDCRGVEAEEGGVVWGGFTMRVVEMRHRIGRPVLRDRTFPVLQMVASAAGRDDEQFLVVSVPVPDFGAAEASRLAREKGAQIARYVSVERIRRMDGDGGGIEWLMATASDAGGVLPAWVQNMAMPGVVWKDVPLFLRWIGAERTKRDVANVGVRDAAGVVNGDGGGPAAVAAPGGDATTTTITPAVPEVTTTETAPEPAAANGSAEPK